MVLRYRSFHGTNFGTQRVLVFISVSTFAQAQVERHGFVVFRCRSYQCKKLGTSIVLLVYGTSLSLVPRHKLRHATRARFFISVQLAQAQVERRIVWYFAVARTNAKNSAQALCRFSLWYFTIVHSTAQTSARNACSFLYPFQHLRMRKLNGYKKLSAYIVCTQRSLWSE